MRGSLPPGRSRSRIGFFVVLTLVGGAALPASGLDFPSELLVYRESFLGESAYPTTPDVDVIGAGGLFGAGFISGAPDPILNGTVATASLVAGGGWLTGHAFQGGPFGDESLGFRGGYTNLVLPPDSIALVSVTSLFDTGLNDSSVRGEVVIVRDALGVASGTLMVTELDGATVTETFLAVLLSAAEASALVAGVDFTIDVLADRLAGTGTATIDIDGFATRTVGPLVLGAIGTAEASGGGQALITGDSTANSQTAAVDFTALEVYGVFSTSFVVDTPTDAVDAAIGDATCATAGALCSLRAAIQESNAIAGPGEVLVPPGTFVLTIAGAEEDAAATGDLDITEDLIIRGANRNTTLIDGGGIDRVFEIPGGAFDEVVHLYDATIRNGAAVTAGGPTGGGIENSGTLIIARCIVTQNQANLAGGILNRGTLDMDDCVVSQNDALNLGFTNSRVGGLASASTSAPGTNPVATIRNSAFVENTGAVAGGVEFGGADSIVVENTTFSGNTNTQVRIDGSDVVLDHVTIVGGATTGLTAASVSGTNTLDFVNSAIDGAPACALNITFPVVVGYLGNNASNDTSCGFTAAGSFEGVPLGLEALAAIANSEAHLPGTGSVLIDSSDLAECLPADQVGVARPLDGDGSGTAECDIGAIELPEPTVGSGLVAGVLALAALVRRRRRR